MDSATRSPSRAHVIVCGYDSLARHALVELLAAKRSVALLCETPEQLEHAKVTYDSMPDLTLVRGEPTQGLLKRQLFAARAEAFVIAMSDDVRNLVVTLNARAVNPKARIVVALRTGALRQTLEASGISYLVSPSELSGRLIASAAFEPEVAQLIEDLASRTTGDVDMQQYVAGELGGRSVREVRAKLAAIDGPLLVAVGQRTGTGRSAGFELIVRPRPDLLVDAEDVLVVITSRADAERLVATYGLWRGRSSREIGASPR
jgi:voltage-gated potassium channel